MKSDSPRASKHRRTSAAALALYVVSLFFGLAATHQVVLAQDPQVQAAAGPDAGGSAGGRNENMLQFLYRALGLRYTLAFLFLSFCFVALVVMNLLAVRRDNIVPPDLVESFEQQLNEKKYQDAFETAKADESFLGKVLAAGMAQLRAGYDKSTKAMEEVGTDENMKLEQRLGYIALIASVSPMVGLLGTVDGMVGAFGVIADSDTTPKPSQLAGDIETALVTTLLGLVLAIPAIAVHTIIRNRLTRLVFEAGIEGDRMMGRFSEVGKKSVAPTA